MLELSSKEKAALRNAAQVLKPAVHVGKQGVSEGVVAELQKAFETDELIKVAFKADRDTLPALADEVAAVTESVCVGGVGKRRSFYRPIKQQEQ